jgi:protein-S-isoprenylcysteine O-methyltransferase Ste14
MTTHGWQWISAILLVACLGSFGWAMRRFFLQPAGATAGMRVIKACGLAFGIFHLAAIIATPGIPTLRGLCGATLYLCALGLFWWAIKTSLRRPLSAAFSPDLPGHLVSQGPYKMIRHPLYCSYLLCWLAGWVATGRLWLAATVAVMLVVYVFAAAQEEKKFTRSALAEEYQQYRARTGLFFPNPLKWYQATRHAARVASASLCVRSGLMTNSTVDTPSKLTS